MQKQNLLDFKSRMGTTINIVRWYSPLHPKCRNCSRWVRHDGDTGGYGYCNLLYKHREHSQPACTARSQFNLIIGEFQESC